MKFSKLDYCRQYLISSQINYTLTDLAEHLENISYDKINRYINTLMWIIDKKKFVTICKFLELNIQIIR